MIGDEPIPPYQRPPLSKAWLNGAADADSLALKPLAYYAKQKIDFRPSLSALAIDRAAKTVSLSDGSNLDYGVLILATGSRPIKLPIEGGDLSGILELRAAADAEALKSLLGRGKTIAIVGGGYIGLEVAASSRALGAEAVVIEREARLLARVSCKQLSTFLQKYHESHGVKFELSASVTGFEGKGGKVIGVKLADGRIIPCDVVLVCVGAYPNDELAKEAGLDTARGVTVNLEARTSDPSIFAIGDVAWRPMPIYDCMFRMESVPNALEQAKQAACAIVGRPAPVGEVPWQWSDQYDLKLQIAGYAFDTNQVLLRGDPASGKFSIFHLQGDRVQSVEAINSPREFMMGRQLIGTRRRVDKGKLADVAISMRDVTRDA